MKITSVFANAQRANRARRAGPSNGAGPTAPSSSPGSVQSSATPTIAPGAGSDAEKLVDLTRRRDALTARLAELQWDLGGLVYEMAIRDRIRVDVLVKRAAALQDVDAELSEVERIVRLEQTGSVGSCASCGAPHSSGATYCWQCGRPLLEQVPSEAIGVPGAATPTPPATPPTASP